MDKKIIKKRIRTIRSRLKKEGIDCLIVSKQANVSYVTGFCGDDSWAVIGPRGVYLLTDNRYTEQAKGQCSNCTIIERKESLTKAAASLVNRLKSAKKTAIENSVSADVYDELKKKIDVQRDNDVLVRADHDNGAAPVRKHTLEQTLAVDP